MKRIETDVLAVGENQKAAAAALAKRINEEFEGSITATFGLEWNGYQVFVEGDSGMFHMTFGMNEEDRTWAADLNEDEEGQVQYEQYLTDLGDAAHPELVAATGLAIVVQALEDSEEI